MDFNIDGSSVETNFSAANIQPPCPLPLETLDMSFFRMGRNDAAMGGARSEEVPQPVSLAVEDPGETLCLKTGGDIWNLLDQLSKQQCKNDEKIRGFSGDLMDTTTRIASLADAFDKLDMDIADKEEFYKTVRHGDLESAGVTIGHLSEKIGAINRDSETRLAGLHVSMEELKTKTACYDQKLQSVLSVATKNHGEQSHSFKDDIDNLRAETTGHRKFILDSFDKVSEESLCIERKVDSMNDRVDNLDERARELVSQGQRHRDYIMKLKLHIANNDDRILKLSNKQQNDDTQVTKTFAEKMDALSRQCIEKNSILSIRLDKEQEYTSQLQQTVNSSMNIQNTAVADLLEKISASQKKYDEKMNEMDGKIMTIQKACDSKISSVEKACDVMVNSAHQAVSQLQRECDVKFHRLEHEVRSKTSAQDYKIQQLQKEFQKHKHDQESRYVYAKAENWHSQTQTQNHLSEVSKTLRSHEETIQTVQEKAETARELATVAKAEVNAGITNLQSAQEAHKQEVLDTIADLSRGLHSLVEGVDEDFRSFVTGLESQINSHKLKFHQKMGNLEDKQEEFMEAVGERIDEIRNDQEQLKDRVDSTPGQWDSIECEEAEDDGHVEPVSPGIESEFDGDDENYGEEYEEEEYDEEYEEERCTCECTCGCEDHDDCECQCVCWDEKEDESESQTGDVPEIPEDEDITDWTTAGEVVESSWHGPDDHWSLQIVS
ncbi:hypothetical protein MKZ38_000506 [Zalerion maritima]|uniref:Uncharacterized protein n=1 Tax=Zalerion maritima TaxID=339359 RepID=A0AAD5RRI6_9PEZI|nr:hypothetical protein MKZ38_000506 [Zalerion maritima]